MGSFPTKFATSGCQWATLHDQCSKIAGIIFVLPMAAEQPAGRGQHNISVTQTPHLWCGCPAGKSAGTSPKSAGYCRICLKRFNFSQNVSCTKESENAQPYQHLRPSNRCNPVNRQFKHQTLFVTQTQTQTQRNLIVKANQMCRICHTLISHWPKNLGYVGFEFTLQLTFGA